MNVVHGLISQRWLLCDVCSRTIRGSERHAEEIIETEEEVRPGVRGRILRVMHERCAP